jgi:dsDNA-specific endonuclease/ATPase MutS2
LLEREREAEAAVIRRLSLLASSAMPELKAAVEAATRWDLARAAALLAAATGGVRPALGAGGLELVSGRYLPCQEECAALGLAYAPLDAHFEGGAIVLFGSNMGGKTVALKTLLFMQLLAQAGLFVPAARFSTRVYPDIHYIGELAGERLAGLSGFGFELWRFQEAWTKGSGALIAFDEPARTTGSHEAEALVSALVEAYADGGGAGGARALFATHFRGVARVPGAEYWRMRGLDRVAACEALDADAPLAERLWGINRHMRYELRPDSDQDPPVSDALAIARMLGLDSAIVERAERYFKERPS